MLGVQARTHWPIVGQGAKSLQMQDIFHRLVKDTIAQKNPVKAISDMRTAIKNTSVVLNIAITQGIILIPSNMIILKEKVAGYNNDLTLATKDMKFSVNENFNYVKPVEQNESDSVKQGKTKSEDVQTNNVPKIDGTTYLLGSAVVLGVLVARYVM